MPFSFIFLFRIVLYSPEMLKHPFSITLFADFMYWTDWDRNAVFKANKFTGQNASLVANSSMVSYSFLQSIFGELPKTIKEFGL